MTEPMEQLRSLVIVEDDETFARTLQRSFERRGYRVRVAPGPEELQALLDVETPTHAVVDLKLGNSSGLPCVGVLHAEDEAMPIVVLTGYASIATAVEAIKLGARQYLVKPSNTDDIEAAFAKTDADPGVPLASRAASPKTREWEVINETLAATGFNISETARRLGMHRRTLARKLEKRPLR